jgi:hypothetical protein
VRLVGVLHHHDVFALRADEPQLPKGGSAVFEQPAPITRIAPRLGDHLGTVEWPDVGLVGVDDAVDHSRINQAALNEKLFERLRAQRSGRRGIVAGHESCSR